MAYNKLNDRARYKLIIIGSPKLMDTVPMLRDMITLMRERYYVVVVVIIFLLILLYLWSIKYYFSHSHLFSLSSRIFIYDSILIRLAGHLFLGST